jgi:hypothetical protein
MKVYISSHSAEYANKLAESLTGAGHVIVSTWHTESGPKLPLTEEWKWCQRAHDNFRLVGASDVFVLISSADPVAGGKFVEAGYASACGAAVFVLGDFENGMMCFAEKCETVEDLIKAIAGTF